MAEENIFLFVPNLIGEWGARGLGGVGVDRRPDPARCLPYPPTQGYARIVFAIISFYFMPCCPLTASSFYLLSGLLDAFDGYAARALNQGD